MSETRRPPVFAALILAAGYSSRMGHFKPLLPLDGKTVIESSIGTFHGAGISRIMVVTGHEAEQLQPLLKDMGISAVHNPYSASGMYSSVQAGIQALPGDVDACFLLPADIPLVRPVTVKMITERYASGQPSVVYPAFQGQRGHPPLIANSLFAEILAGNGEGGLCALLQRHETDASKVEVFDEGILLDMDTPQDYARLTKLAPRHHVPTTAECEAILSALAVPEPICRHGRAVAEIAEALTNRLNTHGLTIDPDLVRAASLLHDIAKGQPAHAMVGAAIVTELGFPEVANIIRQHMDMNFDGGAPREASIVFLADKLVKEDHCVSLEERFRPAFERFVNQPQALRGATRKYATARAILAAVERQTKATATEIFKHCGAPA
ncbi:DVU_1551 family NTP transferase [Rhodoferax sp.]|uniref:DVU_1551 family NTP transferase n=1 Tax=Rhodoferax sp. TaxID=50421 RepID=UPI00284A14F5|nr:NTP transferase domain-containing protein [Rhodoferax sp.]MDR3370927.1 NTP transferase domain-containing protein [Rhodoferax sp.]